MIKEMETYIHNKGMNFYDLAVMTDEGIESCKLQPCNHCNDSYSIAKAFTMTAIGLLVDQGMLRVEDRVIDLLKDYVPENIDTKWKLVTVEHALKHRIGNEAEFMDIDSCDANEFGTKDYLSFVFRQPLAHTPGEVYVYTDAGFYLLGRIVHAVSGETLDRFLMKHLIYYLDFSEIAWSICPYGHPIAGTGLYVRAKDMVKLAWLYMNGGIYEGRRYLSEKWVDQVLEYQYELSPVNNGSCIVGKGGMNGQMICFSKKHRVAVAWHSYEPDDGDRPFREFLNEILK